MTNLGGCGLGSAPSPAPAAAGQARDDRAAMWSGRAVSTGVPSRAELLSTAAPPRQLLALLFLPLQSPVTWNRVTKSAWVRDAVESIR